MWGSYHNNNIIIINKEGKGKYFRELDVFCIDYDDSFMGRYLAPVYQLYTLSMYSILHGNYVSIM